MAHREVFEAGGRVVGGAVSRHEDGVVVQVAFPVAVAMALREDEGDRGAALPLAGVEVVFLVEAVPLVAEVGLIHGVGVVIENLLGFLGIGVRFIKSSCLESCVIGNIQSTKNGIYN